MMYDELVKALRCCGSDDCEGCPRGNDKGKCYDDVYIEAADAIEELSKPRWIPVAERLPERGQSVLVANKRGKQWDIDKAWLSCLGSGFDRCGKRTLYNVTHWMPLPQPPEEEA